MPNFQLQIYPGVRLIFTGTPTMKLPRLLRQTAIILGKVVFAAVYVSCGLALAGYLMQAARNIILG